MFLREGQAPQQASLNAPLSPLRGQLHSKGSLLRLLPPFQGRCPIGVEELIFGIRFNLNDFEGGRQVDQARIKRPRYTRYTKSSFLRSIRSHYPIHSRCLVTAPPRQISFLRGFLMSQYKLTRPLFVLASLLLGQSLAASLPEAQALLDQGKWQDAASMASGLKTADGYALAAESYTLGADLVPNNQKKAQYQKSQAFAKQAIKLDNNNANAHFELARADGRLAQYSGILQSLGLAGEVKSELDTAIKLKPSMAEAYVALGLWNAELTAKGFIATRASGADRNEIVPNFEKAIALEPTNPSHKMEYGNALILQNNKAAAKQFQQMIALPATTFWQKRDLESSKAKLANLK